MESAENEMNPSVTDDNDSGSDDEYDKLDDDSGLGAPDDDDSYDEDTAKEAYLEMKKRKENSDLKKFNYENPKILKFMPPWHKFKDFNKLIDEIEIRGAQHGGICKIKPSGRFRCLRDLIDFSQIADVKIDDVIKQTWEKKGEVYTMEWEKVTPADLITTNNTEFTREQFEAEANSEARAPPNLTAKELEARYWNDLSEGKLKPIYGNDVHATLMPPDMKSWNINKLRTVLNKLEEQFPEGLPGVLSSYLYFGTYGSTFGWHCEDYDAYSVNYLHYGKPKYWYAIPPKYARRFEQLVNDLTKNPGDCRNMLRHKNIVISPEVLDKYGIPYNKVIQRKGEIIITFPMGYHSGFNGGGNCAEAVNFATERWVEYMKRAILCDHKDLVEKFQMLEIDPDPFIRDFQPERYALWKANKDVGPHPEFPDEITTAGCSIDNHSQIKHTTSTHKTTNTRSTLRRRKVKRDDLSQDDSSDGDQDNSEDYLPSKQGTRRKGRKKPLKSCKKAAVKSTNNYLFIRESSSRVLRSHSLGSASTPSTAGSDCPTTSCQSSVETDIPRELDSLATFCNKEIMNIQLSNSQDEGRDGENIFQDATHIENEPSVQEENRVLHETHAEDDTRSLEQTSKAQVQDDSDKCTNYSTFDVVFNNPSVTSNDADLMKKINFLSAQNLAKDNIIAALEKQISGLTNQVQHQKDIINQYQVETGPLLNFKFAFAKAPVLTSDVMNFSQLATEQLRSLSSKSAPHSEQLSPKPTTSTNQTVNTSSVTLPQGNPNPTGNKKFTSFQIISNGLFQCDKCQREFATKDSCKRHFLTVHTEECKVTCKKCGSTLCNKFVLMRHEKQYCPKRNSE